MFNRVGSSSDSFEADPARHELAARQAIERNPVWYHTLELARGVLTPGHVDLRGTAAKVLPDDLTGKRALDVGTFDGFWAFELERRGAEVVAIDVEQVEAAQWPPNNRARLELETRDLGIELGKGFDLAAEVLGSNVERVVCDVLDLTVDAIGGEVDVAFMGALLIHLRDPVRALQRIFDALRPGAALYQLEPISLRLSIMHPRRPVARLQTLETPFNWWLPNEAALRAWLRTAGFADIRGVGLHRPPQRKPMDDWFRAIASRRPQ
jgi:tRNA (mo5U34)-methyltransferase